MEQQSPPHSREAEQGILSCLLQASDSLLQDAKEHLPPEAFYGAVERILYQEMLLFAGRPMDLVIFSQHLINRRLLDKTGGPAFIAELLSFIPTPAHYPEYKGILLDKLKLRSLIKGGSSLIQMAHEQQGDMVSLANGAMEACSGIEALFREPKEEETWEVVIDGIEEEWNRCYQGKRPSAMPSPWSSWNLQLGGIRKGYVLLLGEEKMGKSSLAGHVALHISDRLGEPSLVVTYETSVPDYVRRLACNVSGVDGRFMFQPDTNRPPPEIVKRLSEALTRIRKSRLRVIRGHGMNVLDIGHVCRREKPVFVAVDYLLRLPRLPDTNPKEGTEGEVRANSKALFDLSSEIDGTLMVINHTAKSGDRKGESRWGASPSNDADLTLVIEKDGVHIKSQRNGPSGGKIPIFFNGPTFSFHEKDTDIPYG